MWVTYLIGYLSNKHTNMLGTYNECMRFLSYRVEEKGKLIIVFSIKL